MKSYISALALAAISLVGCQSKQETSDAFNISTESFHWADSVANGKMVSKVEIYVTAPNESSKAYANATKWIAERLGATGGQAKMPMRKLMQTIGEEYIDTINTNIANLKAQGYEDFMPSEYTWRIAPVHFTNQYVTYTDTAYAYQGGAHGSTLFDAATFSLADGKQWGYDMFNANKMDDLRRMVIDALAKQYFKVSDSAEMAPMLLMPIDSLTLPSCPPYLTADGVAFTYQQYEIAPYSEGMPTCVLTMFDVHNLLNADFAKTISE